MRDLEVLSQGVDRQRRADEIGQAQHQLFQAAEVADACQSGHVFPEHARTLMTGPAARLDLAAAEPGLGEPAEIQQLREALRVRDVRLDDRQRMQPQQVIPALQRVAAKTEELQAPAPGHQNALLPPPRVP